MVSASDVLSEETLTCNAEGRGFGVPCASALTRMFMTADLGGTLHKREFRHSFVGISHRPNMLIAVQHNLDPKLVH